MIKHTFVATLPASTNAAQVQTVNWNADHTIDDAAALKAALALATIATTGSGADLTANSVTAAKQSQMPANTVKGNNTGSTADEANLTVAQLTTMLGITASVSPSDVGDGSDGSPVFDGVNTFAFASLVGSTYTLLRSVFFELPTVNVAITLKTDAWPVRCRQRPVNNGVIDISGGSASGPTTGAAAVAGGSRLLPSSIGTGNASTEAADVFPASSAANAGNTAGGAGTNGASATNGTAGRGGGGGAGGNNNPFTVQGTSGGSSPSVTPMAASVGSIRMHHVAAYGRTTTQAVITLPAWGAAGGQGGTSVQGGGAGAPGGYMFLASPGISGTGVIRAKGGNGGAGRNGTTGVGGVGAGAGGGGGGSGGLIVLELFGQTNTNTVEVTGGTGGTGGTGEPVGQAGNGGNGGNGGAGAVVVI